MSATDTQQSVYQQLSSHGLSTPEYVEYVYALVLVWGLGDIVSTYLAVSAVGPGMELNPWMRVLLVTEPLLVAVVKAAVVLYAGVVLLACRSIVEQVPGWQLWFSGILVFGWGAVINNLAIAIAVLA